MAFKFELDAYVEIALTGQEGRVNGRCEYSQNKYPNNYQVHYINGDGDATYNWFEETDLEDLSEA